MPAWLLVALRPLAFSDAVEFEAPPTELLVFAVVLLSPFVEFVWFCVEPAAVAFERSMLPLAVPLPVPFTKVILSAAGAVEFSVPLTIVILLAGGAVELSVPLINVMLLDG